MQAYEKGDIRRALRCFQRAVAYDGTNLDAGRNLADLCWELGDRKRADWLYQKISPDRLDEMGKRGARAASQLIELGERLYREGRAEDALEIFMRLTEIVPDNHVNWNDLGVVCSSLGMLEEAKKFLRKAVLLKQDYEEAWENLKSLQDQDTRSMRWIMEKSPPPDGRPWPDTSSPRRRPC
jgi:Flp pilus assembly protein TadD